MIIEERMASHKFSRKARAAGLAVALGLAIAGATSNNAEARPVKAETTDCTPKSFPSKVERTCTKIGNVLIKSVTTDTRDTVFTNPDTGEQKVYGQEVVRTRSYKDGKRTKTRTVTTRSAKPNVPQSESIVSPTTPPKPNKPSATPNPTSPGKPASPAPSPKPTDPDFDPGQEPEFPPLAPSGTCMDGVTYDEIPCDPNMEQRQEECYSDEGIWRNPTPRQPLGECVPFSEDLFPED